jgi:hypothetical protein
LHLFINKGLIPCFWRDPGSGSAEEAEERNDQASTLHEVEVRVDTAADHRVSEAKMELEGEDRKLKFLLLQDFGDSSLLKPDQRVRDLVSSFSSSLVRGCFLNLLKALIEFEKLLLSLQDGKT